MSKYQKTVKVLSDGTIAKVGMIVMYTGIPIRIKRIKCSYDTHIITDFASYMYRDGYYSSLSLCRKVTPEERKLYYMQKNEMDKK